jgi:hypothetical protein
MLRIARRRATKPAPHKCLHTSIFLRMFSRSVELSPMCRSHPRLRPIDVRACPESRGIGSMVNSRWCHQVWIGWRFKVSVSAQGRDELRAFSLWPSMRRKGLAQNVRTRPIDHRPRLPTGRRKHTAALRELAARTLTEFALTGEIDRRSVPALASTRDSARDRPAGREKACGTAEYEC